MSASIFFPPERYTTDTFIIRSYLPGDGPLLAEALNASYEHLRAFMPWAKPHTSEEEAEQVARKFRARYLLTEDFVLAIFAPDESLLLGSTGFHLREGDLSNRSAEIGMWIRASHAQRGLGTAALRAMLRWGFEAWPWERLSWRCDGRNVASQRTAERAGMVREGILRGHRRLSNGKKGTGNSPREDTVCGPREDTVCGSREDTVCGPREDTVCGSREDTVCYALLKTEANPNT
jgi:RimJ/RimL family protein N-acetyltransferase